MLGVITNFGDKFFRLRPGCIHDFGDVIGPESMQSGCDIASWHLSESRRFFGELAVKPEILDAGKLEQWLIERCRGSREQFVSTREVMQYGPIQKDKQKLESALKVLEEYERAKLDKDGRKKLVRLNPALLEESQK